MKVELEIVQVQVIRDRGPDHVVAIVENMPSPYTFGVEPELIDVAALVGERKPLDKLVYA